MLVFLIAVIVLVLAFVLFKFTAESLVIIVPMFFLGLYGTLITVGLILCSHVDADKQIAENQLEYETIIAEIQAVDTDNEDVSKVLVIKDVSEWNKDVQKNKHWASSPWTSWCYSQKVVDKMEYIEVPEWNVPTPDSNK